jgi:hypothetical protein
MGFAGYVIACLQLYCVSFHRTDKQQRKKQVDKHTHARNNKINEGKQYRKNINGNMQSVTT